MAHPQLYNRSPPLTARAFWKTGVATAIVHGAVWTGFSATFKISIHLDLNGIKQL